MKPEIVRKKQPKLTCPKCGKAELELENLQLKPIETRDKTQVLGYFCPGEGCSHLFKRVFIKRNK